MSANTTPIFGATPHIGFIQASASAVTGTDGTDANVKTVFTAGTNGSVIDKVTVFNSATNAATVVRFWVNNGAAAGTATNNSLFHEETLSAVTLSQVGANASITWFPNLYLPAGYKLQVACGTAATSTAPYVCAHGADY